MKSNLLKLRAKDAEDVQVISAVLQDAIAPVCDMMFNPEDKNFVMVVHRLRREAKDAPLERICCAINLRGIEGVKTHGIDLVHQERMLDLLAIMEDGKSMNFIFAGGAQIKAELSAVAVATGATVPGAEQSRQNSWSMFVEDFGEAWPASCSPCHDAATG